MPVDLTTSWQTIVTTSSYVAGVICLAKSLNAVGTKFPLNVFVTTEELTDKIEQEAAKHGLPAGSITTTMMKTDDFFTNDTERATKSHFLDSPRRELYKYD